MSGSYNLNSARSSELHFSQVVEVDLVDESRVYFTVRSAKGRYSMEISSILVAEFSVEIEDVEVGDKMLFLVYKDGKSEGRLETCSGIVEGKDGNGLDISVQEEKIKLSFNQLKGDLTRVRVGDIVYLRRRNGIYIKGYFRYYPQQTESPSDPPIIIDRKLPTADLKSAHDQDPPLGSFPTDAKLKPVEYKPDVQHSPLHYLQLETQSKFARSPQYDEHSPIDPMQPDMLSISVDVKEYHSNILPSHLQSVVNKGQIPLESNIQTIDSLKKYYLYPVSKAFIDTLKHFFHSYRPMVNAEDSLYKAIIKGYLENLCHSIYPSNILQDFMTKLSEAKGIYAVDDKTEGLRKILLSRLNYLLSITSDSQIRNSDLEEIISDEGFIRPFIIELRGLADNFLRRSRYLEEPEHIPATFENIMKGLSEILNIKIFVFDIKACTYSQYGRANFNFILYYLNNNESLDRLYLHYEHPFSPTRVSPSDLDKYRCNLCKLLPHESVLSLEDTCYCSNCLGYLVSKGMQTCNICQYKHSPITIQTIKKKRYTCSGCECEYNYIDFIGEVQCTHGLCKVCTEISQKQGNCEGCRRVLKPEEVQLMINSQLCGKIDSYENGMMPGCNHFLRKEGSIDTLTFDTDNLRIDPKRFNYQNSIKPADYSHTVDPKKTEILIQDQLHPKVQEEDKEYECFICRVPYKKDNIRTLHCDHSFCDDCLLIYILSWLDNTDRPRAAPCPKCTKEISPVIIHAVMPTTEYDVYNRTCFNASNNRCRKCRTVYTFRDDKAHCSTCDVWLCKECLQNYHEGDCDPRFSIEMKPISYKNIRRFTCPNCKNDFVDSHMRDKALCMKCLTKFCFKCSRLYNPIQVHGYHFHSSKCTRYKQACNPDKFDPACINCREKGDLCAVRTTQLKLET